MEGGEIVRKVENTQYNKWVREHEWAMMKISGMLSRRDSTFLICPLRPVNLAIVEIPSVVI
jgi:hypothetical protein